MTTSQSRLFCSRRKSPTTRNRLVPMHVRLAADPRAVYCSRSKIAIIPSLWASLLRNQAVHERISRDHDLERLVYLVIQHWPAFKFHELCGSLEWHARTRHTTLL